MARQIERQTTGSDFCEASSDPLTQLREMNVKLDKRNKDLEMYTKTLKQDIGELKFDMNGWKKDALEQGRIIRDQKRIMSVQNRKIREMTEQLLKDEGRLDEIVRDSSGKRNEALQNQIDLLKKRFVTQKRSIQERDDTIKSLSERIQMLENDKKDARDALQALSNDTEDIKHMLGEIRDQLKISKQSADEHEAPVRKGHERDEPPSQERYCPTVKPNAGFNTQRAKTKTQKKLLNYHLFEINNESVVLISADMQGFMNDSIESIIHRGSH